MLEQLVIKNRSYRRFNANRKVSMAELQTLVNLARQTASARNIQPLKYALINDAETCDKIFPGLAWAGYLTHWPGPSPEERPAAYILILWDNHISPKKYCDDGIAMQTILLGAVEMGLGGCIIGAFNKKQILDAVQIPEELELIYVLAIGEPAEESLLEEATADMKYWRDEDGIHHVPKRSLDEVIVDVKK